MPLVCNQSERASSEPEPSTGSSRDPARSLPRDARELVERARKGDTFSLAFLEETAAYLAQGLANLIYLLDPQRIILGTIAVAAGDLLLGPLRTELARRIWPAFQEGLEILPAGLGDDLGDHAAFAVARAATGTGRAGG